MAEPNNKPKTISFAGKDVDQSELIRRARQKAAEWAQYQGLKGDEVADFNESLNDILAGISDGRYTVTESGALSGKGSSQPGAYDTKTGQRVDANGGNSRRRRGFDPDSNVMGYLNGIAGALTKSSGTGSSASSSGKKAITASQYLSDQIFGEGNNFSAEQLIRWADAHDAVGADGKRGIEGRRNFINEQLGNYKQALLNGDYNLTDEQRDKEIATIDEILGNNSANPDQDWQLSKIAPWMSHLLFRDAKYYEDETAKNADAISAEQKERDAKAEAYRTGVEGAVNPYEPGSEAHNLLEQRRNEYMDQAFLDDFRTHTWDYSDTGRSFRTQVTELEPDVFSGWNLNNVKDYLSGAEGVETNEYGQDVHAGLFGPYNKGQGRAAAAAIFGGNAITGLAFGNEYGHEDYTGWGRDDETLRHHPGLKNYFDALPNDFKPDDTTFSFRENARSNKAILGKAAADYARSIIGASGGEQYQLADGSYLLPQFVDWDSGKVYRFHLNGNKMTITTDNIGTIINGLTPGSPLYRTLLNEWRIHNQRPALTGAGLDALQYKEGGVLKAQSGAPLSQSEIARLTGASTRPSSTFTDPRYDTGYTPLTTTQSAANQKQLEADQERYATALQNGVDKQRREDYGNETLQGHFSAVDAARIAAAAMDVGSLVSAWAVGPGTAAAGALGLGSTLTTLGADFADKGVSTGQALTGLGINLAMDVASLIPGLGSGAGGYKIVKNLIRLTPKLIPAFTALATGPQAIETLKKIGTDGFGSITKDELRNLSYCLSAVAGVNNIGAAHYKRGQLRKSLPKGEKVTTKSYKYLDSSGETVTVTEPEKVDNIIKVVNEAGAKGQSAAEKALQTAVGDTGAKFANGEKYHESKFMSRLNKEAKAVTETTRQTNPEDKLKWLAERRAADEKMRADMRSKNKVSRWMADNLATDFEIMEGGTGWFVRNPFTGARKPGNNGLYKTNIDSKITKGEADVIEGLKTTEASGNPMKAEVTGRESEAAKKASELAAARDNLLKPELERVKTAKTQAETAEANARGAEQSLKDSIQKARDAGIKLRRSKAESAKRAADKATAETYVADNAKAIATKNSDLATAKKSLATASGKNKKRLTKQVAQLEAEVKALSQDKQAEQYRKALESLKREDDAIAEIAGFRKANRSMQEAHTKAKDELLAALKARRARAVQADAAKASKEAGLASYAVNKPVDNPSVYLDIAKASGLKIEGATSGIVAAKEKNFENFITFLKNNGQKDAQVKEILGDAALLKRARELFKFYSGGVLKANIGVSIPAPEQKKPKPTTPITGTLGNGAGNNGPLSGTLGTPVTPGAGEGSGTLGTSMPAIPGVINPEVLPGAPGKIGWGVNPTDLAITGLESGKYGLTQGINGAIYNIYAGFRGFHETPLLKHYRQWSAKPLEDQIAKNFAEYRRMGARAAAGTTDQNQAFSWQLASTDKAMAANQPLAIQANEQIKTTVDQQNAVGNDNFANMHEVGERNRQGDVALSNARLKAYADYLHKFGTTAVQNMMARQYGMAKAGIANDERSFQAAINTDPTVAAAKNNYNALIRKKALSGDTWTEADEKALREAKLNYSEVATRFRDEWTSSHIATTGTPYAGYGVTYKAPAYYDFGADYVGFVRRGGKMEAAEREKTRREYEKIYHDSMKLMVKESNKKLIAGKGTYAFYRKLFMHAK